MEQLSREPLVIRLGECESTNLTLKKVVREQHPDEGSMVITDYQTAGRGEMGNSWYSSKGVNLLFSLLIYPREVKANEQFIISRMVSLAVKHMLDRFTDDIRIKWPNDIYWRDRKMAGMLIENDIQGKVIENAIIGIGININQHSFPSFLPNPVSLRQVTATQHDRDNLLEIFMREFFLLYRDFRQGKTAAIEDAYMHNLYRVNGDYWFEDSHGRFRAIIDDILPSGHMVLRTLESDELRRYAFKEVAFVD